RAAGARDLRGRLARARRRPPGGGGLRRPHGTCGAAPASRARGGRLRHRGGAAAALAGVRRGGSPRDPGPRSGGPRCRPTTGAPPMGAPGRAPPGGCAIRGGRAERGDGRIAGRARAGLARGPRSSPPGGCRARSGAAIGRRACRALRGHHALRPADGRDAAAPSGGGARRSERRPGDRVRRPGTGGGAGDHLGLRSVAAAARGVERPPAAVGGGAGERARAARRWGGAGSARATTVAAVAVPYGGRYRVTAAPAEMLAEPLTPASDLRVVLGRAGSELTGVLRSGDPPRPFLAVGAIPLSASAVLSRDGRSLAVDLSGLRAGHVELRWGDRLYPLADLPAGRTVRELRPDGWTALASGGRSSSEWSARVADVIFQGSGADAILKSATPVLAAELDGLAPVFT